MAKVTDSARIEFLIDTLGNGIGDIVKVSEETDGEVYYNDGLRRWCYFNKTEEGAAYRYIPKGQRANG